jgi:uncharacterized glyoxalase superfamily protein PhnB
MTRANAKCDALLLFDGNSAEAMIFYQQCLGGELTLTSWQWERAVTGFKS